MWTTNQALDSIISYEYILLWSTKQNVIIAKKNKMEYSTRFFVDFYILYVIAIKRD